MRTCPACGKDTEAGMTERCPHCGFAPGEPDEATASVGGSSTGGGFDTTATPDERPASSASKPGKKKSASMAGTLVRWAVIAGVIVAGIANSGGGDDHPGPAAADVESALLADAASLGITLTVACPDASEDTPVGGRFECTARGASGAVRSIVVTNQSGGLRWSRKPFLELQRVDRGAGLVP